MRAIVEADAKNLGSNGTCQSENPIFYKMHNIQMTQRRITLNSNKCPYEKRAHTRGRTQNSTDCWFSLRFVL